MKKLIFCHYQYTLNIHPNTATKHLIAKLPRRLNYLWVKKLLSQQLKNYIIDPECQKYCILQDDAASKF